MTAREASRAIADRLPASEHRMIREMPPHVVDERLRATRSVAPARVRSALMTMASRSPRSARRRGSGATVDGSGGSPRTTASSSS